MILCGRLVMLQRSEYVPKADHEPVDCGESLVELNENNRQDVPVWCISALLVFAKQPVHSAWVRQLS